MKRYIMIIALATASLSLSGQTSVDRVLRDIEANNKELKAGNQLSAARKLEAGMENNLPDPSVSYTHQYGNKEGLGIQGELVASQSFDFPTVYAERSKLIRSKSVGFDRQTTMLRQQILLQAKELCLDLVLLNQQKSLLDQRRRNAEQLAALYETRLSTGDANILETNKINLELLNARNEARLNETARTSRLKELAALNGGIPLGFADTTYAEVAELLSPDEIKAAALSANPSLLSLQSDQATALRQLRVNKAKGLPGLELGYRLNTAAGGERFNGFLVGVSIPLFANRNNVKQAKAQTRYTELQLESVTTTAESELQRLFDQSVSLRASMDEYEKVLKNQNGQELLNKAIQAGQISMLEYFVDVTTLYQSMQNYLQLQNEYQKVMAQLYKYKL